MTFLAIWLGQTVSLAGSVLTEFALGVYVFQRTGSVTQFALINVCIFTPQIVVPPFAGVLADRWSRRMVMILANALGAVGTVLLVVLILTGALDVLWVYAVSVVFSVASASLFPAYAAAVPTLVPKRHLGRANGMRQLSDAISRTVAPPLGGLLLVLAGLRAIVVIDLLTFAFAIGTLLLVAIPQPASAPAGRRHVLREASEGLRYLVPQKGLFGLLLFFAALNLALSFLNGALTPLVLGFAPTQVLGFVYACIGVGLLGASLVMSVWGGPRRKVYGVLVPGAVAGVGMVLIGLRPAPVLVGIGALIVFACVVLANVCNAVIFQTKVPAELLARAFGGLRAIAWATVPVGYVAAGTLGDFVFRPLLVAGGPLAGSVGQLVGVGPDRGLGLLMMLGGLIAIVGATGGFLSRPVRMVEVETPAAAGAAT